MSPKRVLIVEDSRVVAEHLRRIITEDPMFEVVATASSGEDAIKLVQRLLPDVITMDIQLPGMQGLEATRRIMELSPTPIVVVSGLQSQEVSLTMQALQAGALAVVEKPVSTSHEDYAAVSTKLRTQLAIMSEVKVLRQRGPVSGRVLPGKSFTPSRAAQYQVLGIAASTGGPNALMQVLRGLGPDFALPIVIVQHMTPTFLQGFASWLESVNPFPVCVVNEPMPLLSHRVYLAPCDDRQLIVKGLTGVPTREPGQFNRHFPSANSMFSSMAQSVGSAAIGVLLTGMGEDGAMGMGDLKRAGAFTIAEDETTAIVYGMPAAASRLGAVHESLPLKDIAPRVIELTRARMEAI